MLRQLFLILGLFLALELAAEAQQPGASPNPLPSSAGTAYVIRAGRLIDPESGTASANQMIAIKDGRILEAQRPLICRCTPCCPDWWMRTIIWH